MGGMKAPEDLLKKIRLGNRFLLTSHINPDGDAIGSELGLARLLRSRGKGAVVWNRDPIPTIYRPLPGSDRVHTGEEPPAGFPDRFDGIIVLECPSPDRTGLEQHLSARPVINIDHHLGNQLYGSVNWVDPRARRGRDDLQHARGSSQPRSETRAASTDARHGHRGFASRTPPEPHSRPPPPFARRAHPGVSGLYESRAAGRPLLGEMLNSRPHGAGRNAPHGPEMFERVGASPGVEG